MHQVYLNLWADKLRSCLALLGVLIGVAAVVALVSSGQMASKSAVDKLKTMGTNLLSISIYSNSRVQNPVGFSNDEVAALANVFGVEDVATILISSAKVMAAGKQLRFLVVGANPALLNIAKVEVAQGRVLSRVDENALHCIIGHDVAKKIRASGLFSVLGGWIAVDDGYCQVVGVLKPWASNFFIMADLNSSIILPINIAKSWAGSGRLIRDIVFKVDEKEQVSVVQDRLVSLIRQWKPGLQLVVRNPQELINQVESQQQVFTLLLGVIGGISLLVGGIGIMNVMLASLAERKYEIGLRMALGASGSDIQKMFLLESSLLSAIGGILGIFVGLLGAGVIAIFSNWSYALFLKPIFLGFVVACLVGVFFGFYPAYRASLLDPIVVLRGLD